METLYISAQSKIAKCNSLTHDNKKPEPVKRFQFESAHESMIENPFGDLYKRAPVPKWLVSYI